MCKDIIILTLPSCICYGASFASCTYYRKWLPNFNLVMAYSSSFLQLGVLLDRRVLSFVLPVFFFIVLYSKLPHKVAHSIFFFLLIKKPYMIPFHFMMQELRFIISSVPIFNLSAAIAATRMYVADV